MRRSLAVLAAPFLTVLLLSIGAHATPTPTPTPARQALDPDQRLDQLIEKSAAKSAGAKAGAKLDNFRLIGHSALDGFGDYGDLYALGDFAYVGSRCGSQHLGGAGVQVVDIANPARPRLVSKLANPPYTRAEDLTVIKAHTPSFTGTLAVVGIQACFDSGYESEVVPGLRFFDVSNPVKPVLLGQWDLPRGTIGCHEVDAVQRADGKVLAVCARNLVDHLNSNGSTSIHLIDASNPASPQLAADWSQNLPPEAGVGCLPDNFTHSARLVDGGNSLYVSYWDAGTVRLDIGTPASPVLVSQTRVTPPDEDGDNHSMNLAKNGKWLIINTEDFSPSDCPGEQNQQGGWGEVYVYDQSDLAKPVFLGTFSTDNSRSTRTDGSFADHNTEVVNGDQMFSSWYSDGIVWWTMNDQGVSHQLGQFVPPANGDTPPSVWGVFPDTKHHVILGSDITTGLWIVKPRGLTNF